MVGDGRVWLTGGNFASLANKCGRYSLRNKEISPKITIVGCLAKRDHALQGNLGNNLPIDL